MLAQWEAPMSTAENNKKLVEERFARWARGEGNFFELLADDVRWTVVGTHPIAGTFTSRDEFLRRAVNPLSDRLDGLIKPTVQNLVAEGDMVVAHWTGEARTKDGRPYNNTYMWVMRFEDSRVKEATAMFDTELLTSVWNPPS
jgi:uncharacterized protein